jgi:branched-chain amino acid transport system permease protein
MSGYLSQVAANLFLSVIMAYAAYMSLSIGQLNLGVAGLVVLGAYASAIASTKLGLSLLLCILVGTSITMLAGFLIALSVARMDGIYFSLATFAFAEVVVAVLVNVDAIGAANGYVVPGYLGLGAIATATAIVVVTVAYLMSTRLGLTFTAVRNDERAAAVFGVGVPTAKVLSMVIGAAFAGLAGALYGHHYSYIEAQNFNFLMSANAVLFVLLGGVQIWWGPLLGAGAITLLPEVLRTGGEWRYIVFGAIMVVLMVWRPDGLLTRRLLHHFRLGRT